MLECEAAGGDVKEQLAVNRVYFCVVMVCFCVSQTGSDLVRSPAGEWDVTLLSPSVPPPEQ